MNNRTHGYSRLTVAIGAALLLAGCVTSLRTFTTPPEFLAGGGAAALTIPLESGTLRLDGLYYQTEQGRTMLPAEIAATSSSARVEGRVTMPDGRNVTVTLEPEGDGHVGVRLTALPAEGITGWGFALESAPDEYYTGIMERVVDGPQAASWRVGITEAMNLRGQRVEMIVKPTTSVYAPFYLSSRGYGLLMRTDWPGVYDFAAADPTRVQMDFEGPELAFKIYTASTPAGAVQAHAMESGPPVLPPRWMYSPWRWRDEHRQREAYYDGTPVTGPFNAEVMEDVFMMDAFGIPNGIYWIDRPWGPGPLGYDDFEIDEARLPNFQTMVRWLESRGQRTVLWIGPFFQGSMIAVAEERGYVLPGQTRPNNPLATQNYPMVDLTNPEAKAYWQAGVEKLLNMGVVGFKLDRGEERIPEGGPFTRFDGKSIRENRNTYVALYAQAVAEVARRNRGDDFVAMPRGAYTGSSAHAVFWGGDVGGTHEGLRASIIAIQRSAIMGYPNWGADTGGYNAQSMNADMYVRWLGFSAFNPIMEIGPTRNVGFWNLPREPSYDTEAIAAWRLYARLHERLADYSYAQAQLAHRTGMPIVRPLMLVEPDAPEAWANWWTFQYGPDILVSPVWENGRRDQQVYLPSGSRWRDAWRPDVVHEGGQTITVPSALHQLPIFVREGAAIASAFGDLDREWSESMAIAAVRPNLAAYDAEARAWFEQNQGASTTNP
jgi:alpha-D-xyloside xylohydrolase